MEVEGSELEGGWEEEQFSALSGWQNQKVPVIPTAASGSIGSDWYAERNAHNLFHGKVHLLARGLIAGGGQRCGEGASHGRCSDARDAGPSLLSIACEGQFGSLPSGAAGRDHSWVCHRLTCSGLSVLCVLAFAHLFTDSDALVSFPQILGTSSLFAFLNWRSQAPRASPAC